MRLIAAVPLALVLLPSPAAAFRDVAVGTPVRNRTMATMDGNRAPLLADGKVNVFVFIRSAQEHSESALSQLTELEREFEAKPVRFVAIFSGDEAPEEVRKLIEATGARMRVLVDDADALYGELGVMLHPSAGIVGKDWRLTGYQPFRNVNFLDAMRGQVRLALGEIDAAALAKILDPGTATAPSGGRARARLKLARTLLAAGSVGPAMESARAAVALEPDLADGYLVLAEALAKADRCEEAARAAQAARRLAPGTAITAPPCAPR